MCESVSTSTSQSLLDRAKAMDQEAWGRVVDLYGPWVYGWCRRLKVPVADAPDVVQEVFRAIHQGLPTFRLDHDLGTTFRGWVWTITRNKVSDFFRAMANTPRAQGGSEAQQRMLDIPDHEPPSQSAEPRSEGSRHGLRLWVEPIRAEFEERTWSAFWLTVVEDQTIADAANALGMTPNAVRIAKCRVLRRLRDEFDGVLPAG
jgi:RNA polymerase sigma-70 factor (ECF subfamily)